MIISQGTTIAVGYPAILFARVIRRDDCALPGAGKPLRIDGGAVPTVAADLKWQRQVSDPFVTSSEAKALAAGTAVPSREISASARQSESHAAIGAMQPGEGSHHLAERRRQSPAHGRTLRGVGLRVGGLATDRQPAAKFLGAVSDAIALFRPCGRDDAARREPKGPR
ncbi:hypothetical protein [Bradyrhizobium zhanjiangense]|uniref:Uncharacterized protein n=1 Tax=Bradyrhizobium zhanjiangense TaxID=1325107 RepID=A0A4Q0QAZ3_9BRAD|nr:hypothetical protein [Bradyrhizobium zhanjiangense]RXG85854.1 hypothetical protein EAS61_34905 [Bradyrhizobium zhanjiangense]